MLSSATIIGRTHRLMQRNCHDFACAGNPLPNHAFGLVLDGCGSKYRDSRRITPSHNEVGAKLLGKYAANFLTRRLGWRSRRWEVPMVEPSTLLDELYGECLGFLHRMLGLLRFDDASERVRFIASHLLCTIVGMLVLPDKVVFFWSGDGYICRNGAIKRIESRNEPDYLGYQLLPNHEHKARGDGGFQMEYVENYEETNWLAVATDGWTVDLLQELALPRSSLALQRWLNAQGRKRGHFEDDGAVVAWWKTGVTWSHTDQSIHWGVSRRS